MNLTATGLILLGGFVFGRTILGWWYADAHDAAARQATAQVLGPPALGDESTPLWIETDSATLHRAPYSGTADGALATLRGVVGNLARRSSESSRGEILPAEARLLARLADQTPAEDPPGPLAIFTLPGPVPMAVGVRENTVAGRPAKVGAPPRRVVSWGLGIPLSDTDWTLFALVPAGVAQRATGRVAWPLPPNAQITLGFGAAGRQSLVAFAGPGTTNAWKTFFDQYRREPSAAALPWSRIGRAWHTRLELPGQAPLDVQFWSDETESTRERPLLRGLFVAHGLPPQSPVPGHQMEHETKQP